MKQAVPIPPQTTTEGPVSRSFDLLAPFQFGVTPKLTNQERRNNMANNNNGNQFREDEIVVLTENRGGRLVKSIHPKIGGRLRLAHEQNQQISITTQVIRYDESVAVIRAVTTTTKGTFQGSAWHLCRPSDSSRHLELN
jgi:hypothetical protein